MSFIYTPELIESALTYGAYREKINDSIALPAKDEAEEKMRMYITKNLKVMDRAERTFEIYDSLKDALALAPPTTWLVLAEGWCGDSAFSVPVFNELAEAVPDKIKLRLLLSDENPEVMNGNLTNGSRSIPKLVVLSEQLEVLGHWGPRPAELAALKVAWKGEDMPLLDMVVKVNNWYNADKSYSQQTELLALIKSYTTA